MVLSLTLALQECFVRDVVQEFVMDTLPIKFPSDTERIWQDVAAAQSWTPEQRLLAVKELLEVVEAFESGRAALRHDPFQEQQEAEWQRCMSGFLRQQLDQQSRSRTLGHTPHGG